VRTGPSHYSDRDHTTGPYGGTIARAGTVVVNRPY